MTRPTQTYGIINSDMLGTPTEPGEHVDWSSPDIMTRGEWEALLEQRLEEFAASAPHMIVFEVS